MDVAGILGAISSLAWPVLAGVVLILLLPTIKQVVASRSFTVNFGVGEITVQEASDQLRKQVEDLQDQVVELRQRQDAVKKAVDATTAAIDTAPLAPDAVMSAIAQVKAELERSYTSPPPQYDVSKTILWVDDQPTNNAYEIGKLTEDNEYRVIQATSTADALTALRNNLNPDVIITDMGRTEDGRFIPDAGLNLIRNVRDMEVNAPIYVYTSPRRAEQIHHEVKAADGNGATGSPVELFSIIEQIGKHSRA